MADGTPIERESRLCGLLDAGLDARVMDPFDYFLGTTIGTGLFEDRFGMVRQRFSLVMQGTATAEGLLLEEALTYQDGSREERRWQLVRGENGRFTGRCNDVIGQAHGRFEAQNSRMLYRFHLKTSGRVLTVRLDDRLYRLNRTTVLNRAIMRKWGVRLGVLLVVYGKPA
jgi:hypothetical protein